MEFKFVHTERGIFKNLREKKYPIILFYIGIELADLKQKIPEYDDLPLVCIWTSPARRSLHQNLLLGIEAQNIIDIFN